MMQAYIKTYGCQMNEQDSLQMGGMLREMGYTLVPTAESADLALIVSCSVREKAVQKVYSDIGRLRDFAEANPNMIIGLAGCVAQQEKEKLLQRFSHLDLVFGPDAIRNLPAMVKEVVAGKKKGDRQRIVRARFDARQDFAFVNLLPNEEENRVKAFVTIQKGCDNVCAFCIVPRVRGPEVTRSSKDIIEEIKRLVDLGVKEVTLLGQNVNSYGFKNPDEPRFAGLLDRICRETSIERLRFMSSHPKDVDDALIEQFALHPQICSHFHLPVQSGSDRILQLMRRDYTHEHYLDLIAKLKKARPNLVMTSDIIVGFPGETEEDFLESLRLIKEADFGLSYLYVYSPRPGTTSLSLVDDVPMSVKVERLQRLQDVQRDVSRAQNEQLIGQVLPVLLETEDDENQTYVGRTDTNKIVHIKKLEKVDESGNGATLIGSTRTVKINTALPFSLLGDFYEA